MPKKYSEKWYVKHADKDQSFFPEDWTEHVLLFSKQFLEDFKSEMDWWSILHYATSEGFTCSLKKFKQILKLSEVNINNYLYDEPYHVEGKNETLLSRCIHYEKHDFTEHLLKLGADPNIVSDEESNLFLAYEQEDFRLAKLLLKYGANPNLQFSEIGDTAFTEAVVKYNDTHNEYSIIEEMLKHGANPNDCDDEGDSFHTWYGPGDDMYHLLVKYGMKSMKQYKEEQKEKNGQDVVLEQISELFSEESEEEEEETPLYRKLSDDVFVTYLNEAMKSIGINMLYND